MGYVTSLFACKMVAILADAVDVAAMLASVGIAPEDPWDARQMVPAERYYDMLERLAEQIDATDLPVRAGASMQLDAYGALGQAFKAATTLGAYLCAAVREIPQHPSTRSRRRPGGQPCAEAVRPMSRTFPISPFLALWKGSTPSAKSPAIWMSSISCCSPSSANTTPSWVTRWCAILASTSPLSVRPSSRRTAPKATCAIRSLPVFFRCRAAMSPSRLLISTTLPMS